MSYPPSPAPLPDAERVLVLVAHPDDIDFGAAGTIARWVDEGLQVAYCLATRGETGGFDDTPRERMPAIREEEQRAAAAAVGVKDVEFLDGYTDGALYVTHDLRRDFARAIRRVRPDRVLTQSPLRRWDRIGIGHPDHLAAGEAALAAVYPDARNPFAHPSLLADEGLEAWTVPEVWLMGSPAPDHFVDITDTYERKLAALRAHVSQTAHMDGLDAMLRGWLTANAVEAKLDTGRLAEGFTILRTE
ncbi:MAG TPA: PIG-L deacetylase family protein [Mycobacteriales bacterium]|jgi:LmbE family N-acetylglucosaminyl deacetylase